MTMLLSLKPALSHFAGGLQINEIRSAVLLGLLAFVIYPVLPDRALDPWQLLNPREAWLTVILIAALGFVNYVLLKVYHSKGLYYTAVLGGMVNSTATIAELSTYLRDVKTDVTGIAIVIDLLTVVAMFLRNLLILAVFAPVAAITAAAPVSVRAAASIAILWFQRRRGQRPDRRAAPVLSAFFIEGVEVRRDLPGDRNHGSARQRFFGHSGLLLVNVIGGFVSSASTAGAAAMLAMHGKIPPETAGIATVLTSMASAVSNLPLIHQQLRRWDLSRRLSLMSLAVVALGLIVMTLLLRR